MADLRGAELIVAHTRYIHLELPEKFFIETPDGAGGWVIWGLYLAELFERQPDGSYVCAYDGSPTWLRGLRQNGHIVEVVDGGGEHFTYRLTPTDHPFTGPYENDGR